MKKIILLIQLTVLFFALHQSYSQSWTSQTSGTNEELWSVHFINSNTGIIVGKGGTILKTTNSGANWVSKSSGTSGWLFFLQFINSQTGYASCVNGPLIKTTNTGDNWTIVSFNNLSNTALGGFWYFDENNGLIALGSNSYSLSKILKTVNGGSSWDTVYSPGGGWISYFHFPNSNTGFCTVSDGKLYKTINGGLNWSTLSVGGSTYWTSGVYFFDGNNGFIGGGNWYNQGNIQKTTNGGSNWSVVSNNTASIINFIDQTNGYAIVSNDTSGSGILFKTTNGGSTWGSFPSPDDSLNSFEFQNINLGFVIGDNGKIMRWGFPIGIKTISSEIPSGFKLEQNYPNPFNPSTNIKFSVPKSSFVKLTVYDIIGREVETLVNEQLEAGTYEVKFDGSTLQSGIYFYKLSLGEYMHTRKMLMIK